MLIHGSAGGIFFTSIILRKVLDFPSRPTKILGVLAIPWWMGALDYSSNTQFERDCAEAELLPHRYRDLLRMNRMLDSCV